MSSAQPGQAARLVDATFDLTRELYLASATAVTADKNPRMRLDVLFAFSMALALYYYKQGKDAQPMPEFRDLAIRRFLEVTPPYFTSEPDRGVPTAGGMMVIALREDYEKLFRNYMRNFGAATDPFASLAGQPAEIREQAQRAFVIRRLGEFQSEPLPGGPSFDEVRQTRALIFVVAPGLVHEHLAAGAASGQPADQPIAIELPESWKPLPSRVPLSYVGSDPMSDLMPLMWCTSSKPPSEQIYQDPAAPQYNLMMSPIAHRAVGDSSAIEVARRILAGNPTATRAEFAAVGQTRALAYYRTTMPKPEQHNWLLVEVEAGVLRGAFFILSVEVAEADAATTSEWVRTLSGRIERARFAAAG